MALEVAVLGASPAVERVATREALAFRRTRPTHAIAVLLVWGASRRRPLRQTRRASVGAARRLARVLEGLGLDAVPSTSLVRVDLPGDARDAQRAIERVQAVIDAPLILVLDGARESALEPSLRAACRVVVVAAPGTAIAAVIRDEFARAAREVQFAAPPTAIARAVTAVAMSGFAQPRGRRRSEDGQAFVLMLAVLLAIAFGAIALGALAAGLRSHADHQRAVDLAALAGARALLDVRPRLLGPVARDGVLRRPLSSAAYLELARSIAVATAERNGGHVVEVRFSGGALPDRVTVSADEAIAVAGAPAIQDHVEAQAAAGELGDLVVDGAYAGPLVLRDGKPMRPDVALAYDRLAHSASAAGHPLVVTSAFRADAEQARLFAAHPDPKWVARPGTSLHRLGTELDLGPESAYNWLALHAPRFGFVERYSWEPWHWGYSGDSGTVSVGFGTAGVPGFVPIPFRAALRAAAQRWQVGAAVLAAQLQQESGFDPRARSPAGAMGIAQFMPATAVQYGLRDPWDAAAAIDAQAHLMHDLLARFGSVPLALAAYNAGPGSVGACGCVPGITETQRYVQAILALIGNRAGLAGQPLVWLIR